jgi:hypothetical protein
MTALKLYQHPIYTVFTGFAAKKYKYFIVRSFYQKKVKQSFKTILSGVGRGVFRFNSSYTAAFSKLLQCLLTLQLCKNIFSPAKMYLKFCQKFIHLRFINGNDGKNYWHKQNLSFFYLLCNFPFFVAHLLPNLYN